jgi:hypothetical protein
MLEHMRTSIDLPDALFAKIRKAARARGTTLRALTIEGLQTILARAEQRPSFQLRDASFGKGGMAGDLAETDWERIRGLAYEGRGG